MKNLASWRLGEVFLVKASEDDWEPEVWRKCQQLPMLVVVVLRIPAAGYWLLARITLACLPQQIAHYPF